MSLRDIACDVGECKRNTSPTHTPFLPFQVSKRTKTMNKKHILYYFLPFNQTFFVILHRIEWNKNQRRANMNNTDKNDTMLSKLRSTAIRVMPKGSQVLLYGSRARGTATDESDWDLLLLVNQPAINANDFNDIAYPFVLAGWDSGEDVSPQQYTFAEWKERELTPYYKNVEHDKIIVYES